MQDVTCAHCGRHVQITPDAARCSLCGEDLQSLLIPQYAVSYFYRRSADLAARGDLAGALAEAERGIDYFDAPELRLLAAIIAKRMGDIGTVRFHVAAIPVDDRLRQEAEWLIRAQPGRAAEPVERERSAPPQLVSPPNTPSVLEGTTLAEQDVPGDVPAAVATAKRTPADAPEDAIVASTNDSRSSIWAQRLWATVAMLLLVVAGAMGWLLLSGGPDALLAFLPGAPVAAPTVAATAPLAPITPAPLVLPTPTPQGTPTVPADLVFQPTAAPVADSALGSFFTQSRFDLATVLLSVGREDLNALGLNARLEGGEVSVAGVVTNTTDRTEILDAVARVHGVTSVNGSELLVRVPEVYVVQDGDTLWQIVTYFYGDDAATRVAELYRLNSDRLPSASSISVGMQLKMPPVD